MAMPQVSTFQLAEENSPLLENTCAGKKWEIKVSSTKQLAKLMHGTSSHVCILPWEDIVVRKQQGGPPQLLYFCQQPIFSILMEKAARSRRHLSLWVVFGAKKEVLTQLPQALEDGKAEEMGGGKKVPSPPKKYSFV